MVVKNENIPNTNDNLSEEKSKKIISHYETVIVKLMEELSQQRQLLQKYCCKTRSQENTIVSLRKRVKATKQEKTGNDKFKAKIEDNGVQCNTMRSLIKDLKDEIEALQLEIDSVIRSVLSMVDIDIDFLPSKSTAANITSELGLFARQQLTEEMNNITDCTMLRDATTKKAITFTRHK